MKNFLSLCFCVLLLSSCYSEGTSKVKSNIGIGGNVYVKEVTFHGHSYLEFKDNGITGHGWLHNPDCLIKDIDSLMTNKK